MSRVRIVTFLAVFLISNVGMLAAQDLKAADIIAKSLDSIGTKETRDSTKTLMAVGASEFESMTPSIKGGGKAIVVSDADNLFYVISLNSREYPFDKIGYFNGNISIPFISAGTRSLLGTFVAEHEKLLSDGLFMGGMSLRWTLLDDKRKGQFGAVSLKKIDGKKLYSVEYFTSGGTSSEFKIHLFFDADTFEHVRTEYHYEVATKEGAFGQQNIRASGKLAVTEEFSDFRKEDGLDLPHAYRAHYLSNGNDATYENAWGIKVTHWYINQQLAPDFFTFDSK